MKIAIGVAWWLAVAYGLQLAAFMYDLPMGVGPLVAIPVAAVVVGVRPLRARRSDNRRTYRPSPSGSAVDSEPADLRAG